MSHFTVMVIGDNVEEQLAPYNEQDNDYCDFIDKTEEVKKEYETGMSSEFYCSSSSSWGQYIGKETFDKLKLMKPGDCTEHKVERSPMNYLNLDRKYKGYYTIDGERCKESTWFKVVEVIENDGIDPDICFEGIVLIECIDPPKEVYHKEKYSNIEKFRKDWYGYEKLDSKYGYRANSNSKWDWYQIGGRWHGMLELKKGKKGVKGHHRAKDFDEITGKAVEDLPQYKVDQAKKGDVDWEGMRKGEEYDKACRFWELYIEGEEPKNEEEKNVIKNEFYKKEFYLNKYKTKEKYAKLSTEFSTFAVLEDGEWHERGEMGWWGCSSDTPEEAANWEEDFYNKWIKDLPDDTLITIVDCHI